MDASGEGQDYHKAKKTEFEYGRWKFKMMECPEGESDASVILKSEG